ncbi:MAG: hypothetical protein C0524_19530 [Rhodobacter sp.]|nr:hypothetical protein [Rhodobacter sp.]
MTDLGINRALGRLEGQLGGVVTTLGEVKSALHDPATNTWLCRTTGTTDTASTNIVTASGSIALAGAVDGIQINSTAGTFDVSSFNVFY